MEDLEKKDIRQREVGTILELIDDVTVDVPLNDEGVYGYTDSYIVEGAAKMKAAIQQKIIAYMLAVFAGYHEGAMTVEELELPWEVVREECKK